MPYDLAAMEARLGAPDRDALTDEALAFLGGRLAVNGVPLPAPTAGGLSLLEIAGSPYAISGEPTRADAHLCLFLLSLGRDAVGAVQHATLTADPAATLSEAAAVFAHARGVDSDPAADLIDAAYRKAFAQCRTAFNFFPRSKDSDPDPLCFGAEWLAAISHAGSLSGIPHADALWTMPLLAMAFLRVQVARYEGAKNVDRSNTLNWTDALKELE